MAEVSSVSTREVRGQLRRKSERERGCFPHAVLEAWQRNRRSELGSALWGRAPSSRGKRHRSPGFSCPPPPNISTQLLSWERVAGQGRRTWAHQPYSIQGSVYGQINSFATCDDLIGAAVIFSFTLTCWFISKSFQ